jgi:hypothetical protein
MALSVVDIYQKFLNKTNCGDCGYSSCLAFASMVVSEQLPLQNCPYIDPEKLESAKKELEKQYADGKWTRRDMASDALQWARHRATSMEMTDLQQRIGGVLIDDADGKAIELPYFSETILIRPGKITQKNGNDLTIWEQVFLFNHFAQGGESLPTGTWKGLVEFPNTVSKIKTMKKYVETPLIECFSGKSKELLTAGTRIGGKTVADDSITADVALRFDPLPRVPVMLLFWDEEPDEGYSAEIKLLFDETIVEHLDIESIMFLSERITQLLST